MIAPFARPPTITQADLRTDVVLGLEIERLQHARNVLRERLFQQLKEGARVEPGTHVAYLEDCMEGEVGVERLVVL